MVGIRYLTTVAVSLIAAGSIAFALLFTVSLTDPVTITDKPSRSQSPRDSLPLSDSSKLRDTVKDSISPSEQATPGTSAKDSLQLSESASAQANVFYSIAAGDIVSISDFQAPASRAADFIGINDSFSPAISARDVLDLTVSAARSFLLNLTETILVSDAVESDIQVPSEEDEDERDRGGRGPDRVVFDESYFEAHPSSRLQIRSLYFVDSGDNAITQLKAGELVNISATVRNYQMVDQQFVMVAQICDADNLAMAIVYSFGTVQSADATHSVLGWRPDVGGSYTIKIMILDELSNPSLLSESVRKDIYVAGN